MLGFVPASLRRDQRLVAEPCRQRGVSPFSFGVACDAATFWYGIDRFENAKIFCANVTRNNFSFLFGDAGTSVATESVISASVKRGATIEHGIAYFARNFFSSFACGIHRGGIYVASKYPSKGGFFVLALYRNFVCELNKRLFISRYVNGSASFPFGIFRWLANLRRGGEAEVSQKADHGLYKPEVGVAKRNAAGDIALPSFAATNMPFSVYESGDISGFLSQIEFRRHVARSLATEDERYAICQ